ncbi:ribosomal protection-like ABC-F family protein [Streptomyces sp. NPDC001941]|uniref:ribosomal protection-like ABC-F family protein n=1 Tax=Streptomyces sp. NPDC001941 TaxID=3154659 RepID=UPI0033198310
MRARAQLALSDVSKAYDGRTVLDHVSLTVRPGERVGVIGENGSGKSTLLRLLAGAERPDGGDVTVAFPGGTGHLAQTLALTFGLGPDRTVADAVDASLAELRALEAAIRRAEERLADAGPAGLAAYGDLLSAFEERDGYAADARTDAALLGLGLGHVARDRPLGTLSGGEQARLALACVLAADAELLLLDEPTNHLDAPAARWLRERLRAHRGTVVVITHDRAFLEGFATAILEVDRDTRSVRRYGDGWAGYRAARASARARWEQRHAEYVAELAATEALLASSAARLAATGKDPGQGFGKHRRSSEAKLSGRVRAARTRLEELRRSPVQEPPEPLTFTPYAEAPSLPSSSTPLATLKDVRIGTRLRVADLTVEAGDRLLVTGGNGAGKSTLLRLLAGELAPDEGTVHRRGRVGYLPQELPARAPGIPLLQAYAHGRPGHPEDHAPGLLALGLFREEDLTTRVDHLSTGQRRRLSLARLVTRPTDLLLLDEPTNHVSLPLIEDLERALSHYGGAVVTVTHDPSFGRALGAREVRVERGRTTAG